MVEIVLFWSYKII